MDRRGFISLAALDTAFYGHGAANWWQLAEQLQRDRWLSADDARTLCRINWFGALIANSDMHLGNAGLLITDELPTRIAPVYDTLPMLLRPNSLGQVMPRDFAPPVPAAGQVERWRWAAGVAMEYWGQVQDSEAMEDEVRVFAQRAVGRVLGMSRRF